MALSGYVPEQSNYQLNLTIPRQPSTNHQEGTLTVPYADVITAFKLSNKSWDEWPHPIMLYAVWQKATVTIDVSRFRKYLPHTLSKDKIQLLFISRSISNESSSVDIFSEWEVGKGSSRKNEINSDQWNQTITASLYFRFNRGITTRNNKALWHMALKIHGVVIKYLVKDIAVFSNQAQIHGFGEGKYHIRSLGEKNLKKSFWFSKEIIANENQVKKRKRLRPPREESTQKLSKKFKEEQPYEAPPVESFFPPTEDTTPNPLSVIRELENAEQKALYKKLQEMIRLTREQLVKLESLANSGKPLTYSELFQLETISQDPITPFYPQPFDMYAFEPIDLEDFSPEFGFGMFTPQTLEKSEVSGQPPLLFEQILTKPQMQKHTY